MILSSTLTGRRFLSAATLELSLARPDSFSFEAGQSLRLFHAGAERDYTMISGPREPGLTLLVRLVPDGKVSSFLAEAPLGTPLRCSGPLGRLLFRPSDRGPVFVATGTGIAPFVSMVRSGVRGFTVLYGVRTPEELHYEDELARAADRLVACLSRGVSAGPNRFPGRVTGFVRSHLPAGAYDFYLCGRGEMIRDVTYLVDERFPGSRVFSEPFF